MAGQGKMVHSGEIINLIMRDENYIHWLVVDLLKTYSTNDETNKKVNKKLAYHMIKEIYELELEYSHLIYDELGLL